LERKKTIKEGELAEQIPLNESQSTTDREELPNPASTKSI
jgi:hypothetical protein